MDRGRRRWLTAAVATIVVALAAMAGVTVLVRSRSASTAAPSAPVDIPDSSEPVPSATPTPTPTVVLHEWMSGAASDESADGQYGAWRRTPIEIGGTWDNGNEEQVLMRTICPGGPWARWTKPLGDAIGAIDVDDGESWAAAARGAYDARWRKNLQKIKACWSSRDQSNLYIRFAHEMNLHSNEWRVRGGEEGAFVKAITRYSTLRYQILPRAKIVLCPNDGSDEDGLDIRKLWPGKDAQGRPVADVYAVDSYNMSPHVTTKADFDKKINETQSDGQPVGIEKHRQFALAKGVPFAVSEWGNNGDPDNDGGGGESALYVRQFYSWARSHSGDPANPEPGQLLYEVHFNLWAQYSFWPHTIQPKTAAAYRALPWGR